VGVFLDRGDGVTTAPVFVASRRAIEAGERVVLDGPEGRHAAKVRRLAPGEALDLVDGEGLRAQCVVDSVSADGLVALVRSRVVEPAPAVRVVVVQALAKGDRGERAVEVLTEVGVDEVVPWSSARSVSQWWTVRGDRALERWRSIARESAKQARRARFPVISALATTHEIAVRLGSATCSVVLDENAVEQLGAVALPAAGEVVLVVGPEGGLAPEELHEFRAAGAAVAGLGPSVLRTSTAGVVAAAVVLARTRW
jgi:16S rRNA (uracil1498-N3)-methyltransferase